jgi:hypothetical protein
VGDDSGTTPPDDSGTGPTDDSGTDTYTKPCGVDLDTVFPEDGETAAFYRNPVEVTFVLPDPTAEISLEASGTAVVGSTTFSASNDVAIFTPDEPLEPDTAYDATVTWCDGSFAWSFTTDSFGNPVTDPKGLVGRTYTLSLSAGRWVEPAGAGAYLAKVFPTNVLAMVTDVGTDTISMRLTLAQTGDTAAQDTCVPTQDAPPADFSEDPFFAIGPTDITMSADKLTFTIHDLILSGAFAADGTAIGGVVFGGHVDMREVGPALGMSGDKICAFGSALGFECTACSDGEDLCLGILVDSMVATGVDETLRQITDLNCDVECAASADNKDCTL